jgi:hypothetical protein
MNAQLPAPQSQWMFLGHGKCPKEPMTVVFSDEQEIVAVGKGSTWAGDPELFGQQFEALA